MSKKRRKKKKSGEDSGSPAWMTTYGDMMSLLLAFFILIVSFSSIQESEFKKAMGSLQRALGLLKANIAMVAPVSKDIYIPPRAKVRETIDRILKTMENIPHLENNISFESTDDGIRVRISNPLLFDLGRAQLKSDIFPILDEVGTVLDTSSFRIIIEGHTDNLPISNDRFHSNWELSAARAVAVLEYFVNQGMDPERFKAVAYGEFEPLKPNDTELNRAINRRVEIFIPYDQEVN